MKEGGGGGGGKEYRRKGVTSDTEFREQSLRAVSGVLSTTALRRYSARILIERLERRRPANANLQEDSRI